MKIHELLFGFFIFVIPCSVFAEWQIVKPSPSISHQAFYKDKESKPAIASKPIVAAHAKTYMTTTAPSVSRVTETGRVQSVPPVPMINRRDNTYLNNTIKTSPSHLPGSAYYRRAIAQASMIRYSPTYAVSISGSLKENVERILRRYHWKVIWKAPYDYNFDGKMTASSLPNLIEKLFRPFPLQAVMYMPNRTLVVVPRSKI